MLSSARGVITICSGGYSVVRTIEVSKLLQQLSLTGQLLRISDSRGSNLQLHLADGTSKRITLKHNITDFTVRSVLKIMKRILPGDLFHPFYQDVVQMYTSAASSAKSHEPDQFEKFGDFFVSLMCDKESTLLSRQKAKLAKAVSLSAVLLTPGT